MNTPELQQLKMAWLAARAAGDTQAQFNLLNEHPAEQATLIDFIAAYHATEGDEPVDQNAPLLDISQWAMQISLARVFDTPVNVSNIAQLRKNRQLSKVSVAQGLRLSVDVWNKFETGAIELTSLTQRQLERLALFFQVNIDEFGKLLTNSQPSISLNRRQTREGARKAQQGPQKQSFAEAIARSNMSKEDCQYWLDEW